MRQNFCSFSFACWKLCWWIKERLSPRKLSRRFTINERYSLIPHQEIRKFGDLITLLDINFWSTPTVSARTSLFLWGPTYKFSFIFLQVITASKLAITLKSSVYSIHAGHKYQNMFYTNIQQSCMHMLYIKRCIYYSP